MRIQKPLKGGRKQVSARVIKSIEAKITSLADQFDCSKSFVQNTLLAKALNISIEEHYNDYSRKVKRAS